MLAIDCFGPQAAYDYRFATDVLRKVGEMLRKRVLHELSVDTRVGVIESVWWIHPEMTGDEMAARFADRSDWHWQQMIEVPHAATDTDAEASIDDARGQAGRSEPLVRLIRLTEGRAAQILHVGGPATEPAAVRTLYAAVMQAGLRPRGHLHQIHLVDVEHVPAGRGRSIIRLPIEPA